MGWGLLAVPTTLVSLAVSVLTRLVRTLKSTISLPASLARHYLSLLLSAVLYVFTSVLGIHPRGYIKASKVTELQRVIDHLYAQVDLYRTAMRELKDDIEAKESDRKIALKRLKSTKEEIRVLSEKLYEKEDEGLAARSLGGGRRHDVGVLSGAPSAGMSVSFLLCVLCVVLFQNYSVSSTVLEWKVVMSVGFPILWMYLTFVTKKKEGKDGEESAEGGVAGQTGSSTSEGLQSFLLLCSTWWLIGFLSGGWVARLESF